MMTVLYYCFAFLAGVAIATQASINSQLSHALGTQPLMSAFISFFVGTCALFLVVVLQGNFWQNVQLLPNISLWKMTGGLLGVILVTVTVTFAPKLGLANLLFFIILGQLCSAMLIDHFGLLGMPMHPISWVKLLGLAIMLIGIAIFLFGQRLLK